MCVLAVAILPLSCIIEICQVPSPDPVGGIIGNQVRILSNPVTVFAGAGQNAIARKREKAALLDIGISQETCLTCSADASRKAQVFMKSSGLLGSGAFCCPKNEGFWGMRYRART